MNFIYDKGSKIAPTVAALEIFLKGCKDSLPAFANLGIWMSVNL